MSGEPISIKRYPNRRYYARNTSKYVSLQEIEEMVRAGQTVEIRDSQTGDDLTRTVLTQILLERHPEKMLLFPTDMLHFILRSDDVMGGFLRDYFRHSLTYLDYLQRHGKAKAIAEPMHWVKAWLDGLASAALPRADSQDNSPKDNSPSHNSPSHNSPSHNSPSHNSPSHNSPNETEPLTERIQQLEARLRQLEAKDE